MKRNSLYKSLVVSVALSAFLVGCGSTTNSRDNGENTQALSTTINGKAIDGYIQYATVCLDINKDGYCQNGEPSTQTAVDGSFELKISPEVKKRNGFDEAMLLVYGGKDVDTGSDFKGKLLSPVDAKTINVTPMTTLVAKNVQKELSSSEKLTKEEIKAKIDRSKEKVANLFGLSVAELAKDPVADKQTNPKLIKEILKLQKSIEAISLDENKKIDKDSIDSLYGELATHLDDIQTGGVDKLFEKALKNKKEKIQIIQGISSNIETSFEKFNGDLEKVNFITKEDLKKIKQGKLNIKRDKNNDTLLKDDVDWKKEFIKGDLEDIGITNVTDEQTQLIIDKIGKEKIKPGIVKKFKELLDKKKNGQTDEEIVNIFKKMKKDNGKIKNNNNQVGGEVTVKTKDGDSQEGQTTDTTMDNPNIDDDLTGATNANISSKEKIDTSVTDDYSGDGMKL